MNPSPAQHSPSTPARLDAAEPPQTSTAATTRRQSTLATLHVPPLRVVVAWSDQARRCDLPATSRARLNAATRRAIKRCVQQAAVSEASKRFEGDEVSVSFVSDAEITALNQQYRNKNRPTDVLSWSQSEGENFPDWPSDSEMSNSLGDIVFSIETTIRQARERAHSVETEVLFLAVHGTLHLLGYDHQTAAGRRVMWRLQDQIITMLPTRKASVAR